MNTSITIKTEGPHGRYRVFAADGTPRFRTDDFKLALENAEVLALTEEGEVRIKDHHSADELIAANPYVFASVRWMLETDEVNLKLRREIG